MYICFTNIFSLKLSCLNFFFLSPPVTTTYASLPSALLHPYHIHFFLCFLPLSLTKAYHIRTSRSVSKGCCVYHKPSLVLCQFFAGMLINFHWSYFSPWWANEHLKSGCCVCVCVSSFPHLFFHLLIFSPNSCLALLVLSH